MSLERDIEGMEGKLLPKKKKITKRDLEMLFKLYEDDENLSECVEEYLKEIKEAYAKM